MCLENTGAALNISSRKSCILHLNKYFSGTQYKGKCFRQSKHHAHKWETFGIEAVWSGTTINLISLECKQAVCWQAIPLKSKALICSVCCYPRGKSSHHGQFQAIYSLITNCLENFLHIQQLPLELSSSGMLIIGEKKNHCLQRE